MLKFRLQTLMLVIAIVALGTLPIYNWFRERPVAILGYSNAEIGEQLAIGRPVLVLFTARWNLQSQAQLEANNNSVWRVVRDNTMSVINADCTTKGSQGEKLMQKIGISNVPAFAIYSPNDPLNPMVFGELPNESNLQSALKKTADINADGTMR